MTSNVVRFRVTNLQTGQVFHVEPGAPELQGWTRGVVGWSIGAVGTGSSIEIDEPLEGISLGIFPASNHVILRGECPRSRAESLPEIAIGRDERRKSRSVWVRALTRLVAPRAATEQSGWLLVKPRSSATRDGELYVRFDRRPLKIGNHVVEMKRAPEQER